MVQDFVELIGKLPIDLRDHFLDGFEDVALDQRRVGQGLLDEGRDGVLDLHSRTLGARLEALLEQGSELVRFLGLDSALGRSRGAVCVCGHACTLTDYDWPSGSSSLL